MWWKIRDWCTNALLAVRLWLYVTFKPKRFKILNEEQKDGWDLTFSDEFNQGKLDRKKWRTDAYFGLRFHPGNIIDKGTAPDVYYGDNMFEFTNSTMKQMANNEPKDIKYVDWDGKDWGNYTIPYRIGQVDSSNSFSQKYGYWEIRSKITDQPGSWPAFWMVSTDNYPPEIDVYEIYTGRKRGKKSFSSNFHWRKEPGDREGKKLMNPKAHRVLDVSKDFHTYAVEWNDKCFKVYYDNLLVRVYSNPEAIKFFEYSMHVIIGNGIHVEQDAHKAIYPTAHEVDYVRVYKKK